MRRDLAYWREQDTRFKKRLGELLDQRLPRMPEKGGDWWLARKITLSLAPPFLLTPLATKVLYPWLPQPDAWIYLATGVLLLGVAAVSHAEYRKIA